MKKINVIFSMVALALFIGAFGTSASAQMLLSEVEIDPPVEVGDRCQYVEIAGPANSAVPANTYFISVNSDASNFGFLNVAVDISGQNFGSNGILVLYNTTSGGGVCPNRTFDSNANVFNYQSLTTLGKGSEGFYIVTSSVGLASGTDADVNDNGTFDANEENGTAAVEFIDGFNLIFNPDEQFAYGPGPNLVETFLGDVADAATRFGGNTDANNAAAWYSGELADSPEETTTYGSTVSSNFPMGGMLTPGGVNVPGSAPTASAPFDFDGDGRTDQSIFRPNPPGLGGSSAQFWYLRSSDNSDRAFSFGQATDIPAIGDFTGDGISDVTFWRPSTGEWFVLRSDMTGFFAFPFGANGDVPAPGDYDGDGTDDFGLFRPSTGTFFVLQSSDNQTTFTPFGIDGDIPTIKDFDGDGRDDIAIYRPSLAQFWQLRSTDGLIAFAFGLAGDIAVPNDYTGDGKADVASFRPTTGEWFVLNSDGSGFFSFPFGAANDVPVPGDYDGDGTSDYGVFRPTSNTWFLLQSTSGNGFVTFGAAGDVPLPR